MGPASVSVVSRLADAVAADVAEAFGRFVAARADDSIVALALCTVEDAVPPYIMGAVVGDLGPILGTDPKTWRANPADWSWSDQGRRQKRCVEIVGEILDEADRAADLEADDSSESFRPFREQIMRGMADGLKKFDGTGAFKGKLARGQMLLLPWIHDPSEENARLVMKLVGQINPKPVSRWFNSVYPHRP